MNYEFKALNYKLIRDKIPEIINKNRQKCQVKKLSKSDYKLALKYKLLEESQEVFSANEDELVEEIADVFEVLEAMMKVHKISKKNVLKVKRKKQKLKGKFKKKLVLFLEPNHHC